MFSERHSQRSPSGTGTPSPASASGREQSGRVAATHRGQKGVALLMTLGVLALLLILAMSFAFNARTERAASAVNADMIRARLLCESGLERAMAYVKNTHNYASSNDPGDLFPATDSGQLFFPGPGGDWGGIGERYYAVSMQSSPDQTFTETALAVNLGFDFTPTWQYQTTQQLHANRSWQPVKADGNGDGDTTDADDPLIGRIAFLIIDESGKVDPNGVVTPEHEPFFDANSDGTRQATEHYFDVNGNGSFTNTAVAEGSEFRAGGSPQEINGELAFTGIGVGDLVTKMPANAPRWFSWRHLRAGLWGAGAGNDLYAKAAVKAAFPFSYDIDACSVLEGAPAASVDKHRFDLARTDWDTVALADIKAPASNYWTDATRTTVEANTSGLPWVTTLVASDASTSVADQVCANLKDYCDSDSIATLDGYVPASGTWSTPPRTLASANAVGLEKVPYINEVAVTATLSYDLPSDTSTLTLVVNAEVINMYEIAVSGTLTLDLAFANIPAGATPTVAGTTVLGATLTAAASAAAHAYGTCTWSIAYTWTGNTGISQFRVTDAGAVLTDGGGNVLDLARLGAAAACDIPNPCLGVFANVEVADPRCNTVSTDWQWQGFASANNSTIGARNSNSNATTGPDAETVADPAGGLSTAFIRNAPMKSLWELGAIHRGEKWRTLRLSKYNTTSPLAYTYDNGDANILEQVKLGPYTTVAGRFNANSPQASAWRAALGRVTVNATGYDAPETGTALPSANIDAMIPYPAAATAGTILASNGGTAGAAAANRGAVARAVKLSDGSGGVAQDTDRKKEEIIGKLANLLTVRQNYFTVVVTAQAIKDLGILNVNQPGVVAWNDAGTTKYCRVLAEQKIMALVYRDAFSNSFRIERYEYLEE